jgi:hypothetical protein
MTSWPADQNQIRTWLVEEAGYFRFGRDTEMKSISRTEGLALLPGCSMARATEPPVAENHFTRYVWMQGNSSRDPLSMQNRW